MNPLERAHASHQEAMDLAEEAYLAQRRGEYTSAAELNRRAFMLEAEAANALAERIDLEPTRSILYRSAATLAMRCDKLQTAERLATLGLSGNPPIEITAELHEVLQEVNRRLVRESSHKGGVLIPGGGKVSEESKSVIHQKLYFNGVNPKGKYLMPPAFLPEVIVRLKREGWQPPPEWVLQWAQEYTVDNDDQKRKPILSVDRPWDLAETGWCVIFAPDLDPRVRSALGELLEHRRQQAMRVHSNYYRDDLIYRGESTFNFLKKNGSQPGMPADPDYFPYYVLLVGDPESIPYKFQSELDVNHAVGRIYFENPRDYENYARSVVRAENRPRPRSQEIAFFGTEHKDDPATQQTAQDLIHKLAGSILEPSMRWTVNEILGAEAHKEQLRALLGGAETPAFLFAACHGVGFDPDDPRQEDCQGALVCQDWPGPADEEGIDEGQWFAASDVPEKASLEGLVAFFYACFGAGTPERDNFDLMTKGKPARIAPRPLISRLPQRLLSHPDGGALAVIGHVDRAFPESFSGSQKDEGIGAFLYGMRRLLQGHTVGWAMEYFNQSYAALAAMTGNIEEEWHNYEDADKELFAEIWLRRNDARNFMVFGDPAVRLPGVEEPPVIKKASMQES